MKWMLVVLVGGVSPVNTDLVFDKFSDCLAAEEQMRQHYADAFDAWDRMGLAEIAAETGFADQSHLSRWVRRVHGVAPSELA